VRKDFWKLASVRAADNVDACKWQPGQKSNPSRSFGSRIQRRIACLKCYVADRHRILVLG